MPDTSGPPPGHPHDLRREVEEKIGDIEQRLADVERTLAERARRALEGQQARGPETSPGPPPEDPGSVAD